jgi:hypothetical protein
MTPLSKEEMRHRRAAIVAGPWAKGVAAARGQALTLPRLYELAVQTGYLPKAAAKKPAAALRFAGFLAHLRAFYADEQIQQWTRFLDDKEPREQNRLWKYLRGKQKTPPARTAELLAGCQLFVNALASAFHILNDDELGRFGLIHACCLQKFFGYRMPDIDSWAKTVSTSQYLIPAGTDPEIAEVLRRQFREQIQLLERTFDAVRALAERSPGSRQGL